VLDLVEDLVLHPLVGLIAWFTVILVRAETDVGVGRHAGGAHVRGHDDDRVLEVDDPP